MPIAKAIYDFSGCVAIVTGGTNGIGDAICKALKNANATVVTWDVAVIEDGGSDCLPVDVTDVSAVENAAALTVQKYRKVDIVVNNAGYAGSTVPVEHYNVAEWRRIIDVNLTGTFNVCRALIPHLKSSGQGRVVNIASLAGKEGTPNSAAYSASKAGMIAFTKALGKELVGTNVLVNGIAPAAIRTSLLEQMSADHVTTMIAKSPMGRLGTPSEVAELVLWLCSGSCTFSTGAIFDLSGGRATY